MITLGLTGSIGMGKTATAELFLDENVPTYDADAVVHTLYEKGGAAVEPIEAAFPSAIRDGAVDRTILRELVLGKTDAMKLLETIVHPLAGAAQQAFRAEAKSENAVFVVLDIPLLYETGGDAHCDYVLVVTAPEDVQRARVLARPGMTEDMLDEIRAKQMPDAEKRARADFIISTAHGFDFARAQVQAIMALMIRLNEDANDA